MTWPAEAPLMSPPQRLRAGLLRGCLRLLFRGLVRPPMPVALQRGVLRGLSLAPLVTTTKLMIMRIANT
ncbi:alpha/beta hydrolase, partial [Pseudomonas aeruginosa]|nr:alpha/beta hydrolase [Pseudomonas aeruginosa]